MLDGDKISCLVSGITDCFVYDKSFYQIYLYIIQDILVR